VLLKLKLGWARCGGDGLLKQVLEGKRQRERPRFGMINDLKGGSYVKDEEESSGQWHGDVGCLDLPEGRELMMITEVLHLF